MTCVKKYSRCLLFVCVFLFLIFVMWCSPMVSDDYEFAAKKFASAGELLNYVLYYGNGRLLGNISALTMVAAPVAAMVFKALVVASVIFLLPAVLDMKHIGAYIASFLLLVGINDDVFGEVYTWTSGFGNYLPPIWITLLILYLIRLYPDVKSKLLKGLMCGAVLVLGVAGQLFVEHTTLINVLLAFLLTGKELLSEKKERALICGIWAAATVLGAAVMFAIPKIFYIENNRSTGYRSFHIGSILAIAFAAAKNTMKLAVGYLGAMGCVLCGGGLITVVLTREKREKKWNRLFFWICAASLIYQLVSIGASAEKWYGQLAVLHHLLSTVAVIPPLFVWMLAAWKLERKSLRNGVLCILVLAFVSLGVLLVVSPVPMRVIYQSYVYIAAAFLLVGRELSDSLPEHTKKPGLKGLGAAMAAMILVLGCVFLNIRNMSQLRERHIAQTMAQGADTACIFRMPYDYIFWENDMGMTDLYYYNEPGDLKLVVVDFDTWCSYNLDKVTVE